MAAQEKRIYIFSEMHIDISKLEGVMKSFWSHNTLCRLYFRYFSFDMFMLVHVNKFPLHLAIAKILTLLQPLQLRCIHAQLSRQ